jgi:Tfp pilus assembly protein PilX
VRCDRAADERPTDDPFDGERLVGDRGSGLVAGIAFMFAFTFLGLVWVARDVDRGISNQSAASSIAFQAARSGAQAARVDDLRRGDLDGLDPDAARAAATATASQLFASYRVAGSVTSIDVDLANSKVTVTVTITDGSKTVTGVGAAEAVEVQ